MYPEGVEEDHWAMDEDRAHPYHTHPLAYPSLGPDHSQSGEDPPVDALQSDPALDCEEGTDVQGFSGVNPSAYDFIPEN